MTTVVIDASVALAWLRQEARPDWVDGGFADARLGVLGLTVPSLFWLEVGNAFVRDRALSDEQAIDGMLRLEALGIDTVEPDIPLRLRTLQLARELDLTMYDASYLALADALKSSLATLDRRLDAAAESRGLSYHRRTSRISENTAFDGPAADPISLAAIGAALAELRRAHSPS